MLKNVTSIDLVSQCIGMRRSLQSEEWIAETEKVACHGVFSRQQCKSPANRRPGFLFAFQCYCQKEIFVTSQAHCSVCIVFSVLPEMVELARISSFSSLFAKLKRPKKAWSVARVACWRHFSMTLASGRRKALDFVGFSSFAALKWLLDKQEGQQQEKTSKPISELSWQKDVFIWRQQTDELIDCLVLKLGLLSLKPSRTRLKKWPESFPIFCTVREREKTT